MKAKEEHKKYLKNIKWQNIKVITSQILIFIVFMVSWQILSDKGVINTFLCSSPKKVLETIISLYESNDLLIHVWVTLKEILISFGLGSIIGIIFAAILWWSPFLSKVLDPYLTILNSLPKVSLGPIIIIWAGANQNSIILMALLISTISTIISVYVGFKHTNKTSIKLLKSFNANKFQTFIKAVLPYNINTIISSLKINLSMTFVGVIMGELLVSKQGLGYLINYGSQVFNTNLVIAGVVLLAILTISFPFSQHGAPDRRLAPTRGPNRPPPVWLEGPTPPPGGVRSPPPSARRCPGSAPRYR